MKKALASKFEKFDNIPGAVLVYRADEDEEIIYSNRNLWKLFECISEKEFLEITGGSFKGMVYADDLAVTEESIRAQVSVKGNNFDHIIYRIKTKNENILYIEDYGSLVDDPDFGKVYYVFMVIPDLKSVESYIEPLTGFYSLQHLIQILEYDRKSGVREGYSSDGSIVYLNISKFNLYNNAYGFKAGNECLKKVAAIIREVFGTDRATRHSGDRFVLYYPGGDVLEKIREVHDRIYLIQDDFKIWMEAGVYRVDLEETVQHAFDKAKLAADRIRDNGTEYYFVYTGKINEELELKKYVQDNIDRAIDRGFIKVYYQPVIRTLTGNLTSMEALARWEDPVYGFLPPSAFVPALEERSLAYKLDFHILNQVASSIRARKDAGLPVVQVSINISRKDFDVADPFRAFEDAVIRHNISSDNLCVEITESVIMENPHKIREEIRKFRDAGYEVWMDDFGSAYSSLNTLKDFSFDEIKIDMAFLQGFNEKSKNILSSIVAMAKSLGVHTLAEGVETEEQAEFLREIGCEKIQGYLYGRPQTEKMFWKSIDEANTVPESKKNHIFYDDAGHVNFITEDSFGLFEEDGGRIREIFLNEKYRKVLSDAGHAEARASEKILNSPVSGIAKKIRNAAVLARERESVQTIDFTVKERAYRLSIQAIAKSVDSCMFKAVITDISYSDSDVEKQSQDLILSNLINAFEAIYLVDFDTEILEVLHSLHPNEEVGIRHRFSAESELMKRISEHVFWQDRERFMLLQNSEYVSDSVKKTGRGNFSEYFRFKQLDGTYEWMSCTIISIPGYNARRNLLCLKSAISLFSIEGVSLCSGDASSIEKKSCAADDWKSDENLWKSLVSQSNIKFFWKDRQRRFVGASRSFLDYYGFESQREIQNRTDEDLGWHLNDTPFKDDEISVVEEGRTFVNVHGTNIINGSIHNIEATKFPIYRDGKIAGLLGYFIDTTEKEGLYSAINESVFMDPATGFMNARGFLVSTQDFEDNYKLNKENYAIGMIDISTMNGIYSTYGLEFSEKLAKLVADRIKKFFDRSTVFARLQTGRFALCTKTVKDIDSMRSTLEDCVAEIRGIKEFDGRKFTLNATHGEALGSESNSALKVVELMVSRMTELKKKNWNLSVQELQLRIEDLKVFFDSVRLVDVQTRELLNMTNDGTFEACEGTCCSIWGRKERCANCTSTKALSTMGKASKFEFLNNDVYFVLSHYVNVAGKPYAMEAITKVSDSPYTLTGEKHNLFEKLSRYRKEVYTDSLTGIRNRKYYDEQVSELVCDGVAFVDLDKFKSINDTYGHRVGDIVLKKVAAALKESIRGTDVVCRYGGDEFVVCFWDMTSDVFSKRLTEMKANIDRIRYGNQDEHKISASVGGFYGPGKADSLVIKADEILYEAKKSDGLIIERQKS